MSKYNAISLHLTSLDAKIWEATFDDIEKVLGFPLPDSARQHQAWWSNQRRAQSLAWESAGWKTTGVDLDQERVTFVYVADRKAGETATVAPLSISEAKAGLAATFGVSVEAIEIVIRA
jgi:hypothetical protein